MAWYALYKWYKNWSRRKYPNMIDWYSEKTESPKMDKIRYISMQQYKPKEDETQ